MATATKSGRTMTFVPNGDPVSPYCGKLTLNVGKDTDVYLVIENATGSKSRAFTLTKLIGDFAGYDVVCGPMGQSCTCPAGVYGRTGCKHRDALAKLMECGRL